MLVPVPAIAPGLIVHTPVAGKPLRTTLPVAAEHEDGWIGIPAIGAAGADGAGLITTSADGSEVHPASLVTIKL